MRLVSFSRSGTAERLLGALEGDRILELGAAAKVVAPGLDSAGRLRSLDLLLGDWDQGLPLARSVFERAGSGGSKHPDLAAAWHPRARVTLHSPVSRPPTLRDFYSFEAHVKNARARRSLPVPPEWYEFPAFYFSNPGSLLGDGAPVSKPSWTEALDYELEIACVIGTRARDVPAERWRSVVAGLTILNDWSARDVQRKEMAIGLGPAKGKDFATSLGPALVTLDEVEPKRSGDRYDLAMEARVNGATLSRGNAKDMHYTFGQMIARASQDVYLFPGDIIGSGTVGSGCLLELGEKVHPWLRAGDEVVLEIDRLGTLTNPIV
ncbi:MAG: fumarylacetoacetate hydrolase family protein [Candidatus Eisenbacteria bacterium]|uniref:Fumarylacetoacetate hydrolase family protein n=1 Tax=Eiseniibacteriota bacterium TaxID=2212470 RepID=A0A538T1S0_UNCEI|nr:MAG: fumarylacetoacetate hydrolase family protein [Candidatus Eisenbacteria bacterium]